MRVLFIGDVMGPPGVRVLTQQVPRLRRELAVDLVIANAENVAGGAGVTSSIARQLFASGVDVLSNGNHAWDRAEAFEYIATEPRLLRPHNFPASAPGTGWIVVRAGETPVGVLCVLGTVFMSPTLACPFAAVDQVLEAKPPEVKVLIVDYHAETTTEKTAMGWYVDGRVSAVVGTHTHIPTADERILPNGTAYLTDVGMSGCYESVIGLDIQRTWQRLIHKVPAPYDIVEGPATLCAVLIEVDSTTGKATHIQRIKVNEDVKVG
jgi:metallophosphoesterase (TIGR00282 family)